MEIKDITFWADECFVPDYTHLKLFKTLISPYSASYVENYKGLANFKYEHFIVDDSKPKSKFKFVEGAGRFQKVMRNANGTFNPKMKNDCAL